MIIRPQHPPDGDAEGIDVAPRVRLPETVLLRWGISLRAEEFRIGFIRFLDHASNPEIDQLDAVGFCKDDVGWLDIPMDDALAMQRLQAFAQFL